MRPRVSALLAAVLALFTLAPAARALLGAVDRPHATGGYVWAVLRLDDLFPPRVEKSLDRGMPATLLLHVELWRHRSGWFDRLESAYDTPIKVRYDLWSEQYRVERRGAPTLSIATLDSVRAMLSLPMLLPTRKLEQLDAAGLYYLSVSVTLKPLSVEDLEEGEGWLSGEVESKRHSGFGIITGLPHSLFDAVRNFAGFGDQRARAISGDFDLQMLGLP